MENKYDSLPKISIDYQSDSYSANNNDNNQKQKYIQIGSTAFANIYNRVEGNINSSVVDGKANSNNDININKISHPVDDMRDRRLMMTNNNNQEKFVTRDNFDREIDNINNLNDVKIKSLSDKIDSSQKVIEAKMDTIVEKISSSQSALSKEVADRSQTNIKWIIGTGIALAGVLAGVLGTIFNAMHI